MKSATRVFNEWVINNKDDGMQKTHSPAVMDMLQYSLSTLDTAFSFIDAGCGNGWVVRYMNNQSMCETAIGVDGAIEMINKAKRLNTGGQYILSDLMTYKPKKKVDLVLSMEVFYYFSNPNLLIQHITDKWLNTEGRLIMGIDYYTENKPSENWRTECDISIMTRLSISEWVGMFIHAGLNNIQSWQVGAKDDWAGTLVVTGIK